MSVAVVDEARRRCLPSMAERSQESRVIRGPTYAIFGGSPPYDNVSNMDIRRFMPPYNLSKVLLPTSFRPQRDLGDIPEYREMVKVAEPIQFGEFMGTETCAEMLGSDLEALTPGDMSAFHEVLMALSGTEIFRSYRKAYATSGRGGGGR